MSDQATTAPGDDETWRRLYEQRVEMPEWMQEFAAQAIRNPGRPLTLAPPIHDSRPWLNDLCRAYRAIGWAVERHNDAYVFSPPS